MSKMTPVVGFVSPAAGIGSAKPSRPRKFTIEEACQRSLDTPGSPIMFVCLPGYFLDGKHITEAP